MKSQRGQTVIEYTLVIGVVVTVLAAMLPFTKRAIQSVIKILADEIGEQANAEQVVTQTSGYLILSESDAKIKRSKSTTETLGVFEYQFDDVVDSKSEIVLNLGFTQRAP